MRKTLVLGDYILIAAGMFFISVGGPHLVSGDGVKRFLALRALLERGEILSIKYSLLGPIFSAPLYLFGKICKTPLWCCARYNSILIILAICGLLFILLRRADRALTRKFVLVILAASMFPHHAQHYYGEVFTSLLVMLGLLLVACGNCFWGWTLAVIGVVNTPATIAGLALAAGYYSFYNRKFRHLLPVLAAGGLILMENLVKYGDFTVTGYFHEAGFKTIMPYSGRPGFSYPFFLGLLSILFSFGKGIFFFAPGLLLGLRRYYSRLGVTLYHSWKLWLFFLTGIILIYAKWWAWYGGWFWGPRIFLFASIPASLALAGYLQYSRTRTSKCITLVVLLLSVWVGVSGAIFGQNNLAVASWNNYALEHLCWYVPEFSVLWRPFVAPSPIDTRQILIIIYSGIVFLYLAVPLLQNGFVRRRSGSYL